MGLQINISANPLKDYAGDHFILFSHFILTQLYIKKNQKYWENIKDDLEEEQIVLVSHHQEDKKATVVYNNHYSSHTQAIEEHSEF